MRLPPRHSTNWRNRRPLAALALGVAVLAGLLGHQLAGPRGAQGAAPKNIVFILTDDQTLGEMQAMSHVREEIADQGVTFTRAYISYPLCCPSRATFLTGQYMHNHLVRGNAKPNGGWQRFRAHESDALPVWLQDAGYYTVHIGKYLNGYDNFTSYPPPVPVGWDQWYGKVSEANLYYDYNLVESDGIQPAHYQHYGTSDSDYQTDVLAGKALDFIDGLPSGGGGSQTPFELNLWVNAPHAPFEPAGRHLNAFYGTKLPKPPGFNEKDITDKPKWLRNQVPHRLSAAVRSKIASERRSRLAMLLSVDEAVDRIVQALDAKGILDDTYIIFSSDNGYFFGEHRIAGGKYLAYEPSSHVPLIIRGPGIPAGEKSGELVDNADVAQTMLQIAGGTDPAIDGRSLLPYAEDPRLRTTRPILLEADTGPGRGNAGFDADEARTAEVGLAGAGGVTNLDQDQQTAGAVKSATANGNFAPAYRAIRTNRYLYVLYANGQSELYDMSRDPAQLHNLASSPRFAPVRRWLFNRLVPLAACKGAQCRAQIGDPPRPLPKHRRHRKHHRA